MHVVNLAPAPAAVRMAQASYLPPPTHRCAYMGQNVTCEKTPEGGTVCSDGTYHPPGCPTLPPVRAEQASSGGGSTVPILIGVGGLGILTAIFALTR